MSDSVYSPENYVQLSGGDLGVYLGATSTGGTYGADGTTIGWSFKSDLLAPPMAPLTDLNSDGLKAGEENWILSNLYFSGYTITVEGVDLPIFARDFDTSTLPIAYVLGPSDLLEQIPQNGFTNVYAAEAPDAYMCFGAGTAIATPGGAMSVEALQRGDEVLTAEGAVTEVVWIGRQTVSRRFADPTRQILVEVAAGALGDDMPRRDLRVTADHAVMLDGLLVNAGALVGAKGIDYVPLADLPDIYTIYHVETAAHDVILAEGVAAETFIDYAGRRRFDNYAEYAALYPQDRIIPENPAPRISSARLLPPDLARRLGLMAVA